MRILYFSDNISGHNRRFLRKLAASSNDVWFCDFATSELPADWLPRGIRPYFLEKTLQRSSTPEQVAILLPAVRRMFEDVKPDVVHVGPVQTCGYLVALAQFHPMLLTSWGSDILLFSERDESWRKATRVAVGGADGLFVDSEWVLGCARRYGDVPDERVVMFPWGIEPGHFGPQGQRLSRKEFQREPGTCVILCTRSWEPLYGMETLLRAFLSAFRRDARLRLLLIGGGSQAEFIRGFVREHRLEQVVAIPGLLDGHHLPRWFRAADGYISCAKGDGTSISLLEAMATGLPVIVTDIPSNREWVTADVNGWLGANEEEFAAAMLRTASLNDNERSLISAANRKLVSERADWDQNFPKLLAMYEYLRGNPRKAFQSQPSSM